MPNGKVTRLVLSQTEGDAMYEPSVERRPIAEQLIDVSREDSPMQTLFAFGLHQQNPAGTDWLEASTPVH